MTTPRTIRVLVVDDDPGDFEMARAVIEAIESPDLAFEVDWAASYVEGVASMEGSEHDLYLVDYLLEDRNGLDLVRKARETGLADPVVLLTGRGSPEIEAESLDAGASDYLVKGEIDPERMERTIRYVLGTERTAAEGTPEDRNRIMFEELPVGLYRVSPGGDLVEANPALRRILGDPDADTLRRRYAAHLYVAPSDRDRFEALVLEHGVVRRFDSTVRRVDGTTIRIRNTGRAHRAEDGSVLYYEGAVEDVGENRWAALLREAAEHFDAVYQRSGLALLLVEVDGTVREGNSAFQRSFGYRNPEIARTRLIDLVLPGDRSAFGREITAVTSGEVGELDTDRRFRSRDGAVQWARVRGTVVRDSGGDPDHLLLMFEQIARTGEPARS